MNVDKQLTISLSSNETKDMWNILAFLKESNKFKDLNESEKKLLDLLLTHTAQSESETMFFKGE